MTVLSHYTGGANGWGTLVSVCADCGEIVAEYECDENGVPTVAIFDDSDTHTCPEFEED